MKDDNLLDEELAGPSKDLDSPATFSKKIILKFRICHTSTGVMLSTLITILIICVEVSSIMLA